MTTMTDDISPRLTALENRVGNVVERLAALESRVGNVAERVAALEGQVGEMSQSIQDLRAGQRETNVRIAQVNDQLNAKIDRLSRIGSGGSTWSSGLPLPSSLAWRWFTYASAAAAGVNQ